jgi:hypothetical protein
MHGATIQVGSGASPDTSRGKPSDALAALLIGGLLPDGWVNSVPAQAKVARVPVEGFIKVLIAVKLVPEAAAARAAVAMEPARSLPPVHSSPPQQ